MRPTVSTGDVPLSAQAATSETVAPFGRLLLPGDRTYLGKRGRVLLAMDEKRAGPRRVTDLFRYPEAKRVFRAARRCVDVVSSRSGRERTKR